MGMSTLLRRSAISALVVLLSLSGAAVAASDGTTSGRVVEESDPDVVMQYGAPPAASICYVDIDGGEQYGPGDAVVLTFQGSCSGNSGRDDIRLSSWPDHPAGERLGSGRDQGLALRSIDPAPLFQYVDLDGSNDLSVGDEVYLRIVQGTQNMVRVGDVRITAMEYGTAGSQVITTDADINRPLALLGTATERIRWVDVLDTNTFDHHDAVYLTASTEASVVGMGDVRIYVRDPMFAFGSQPVVGDPDLDGVFRSVGRHVCVADNAGEVVHYLSLRTLCTGSVTVGDVRLSGSSFGAGGSRVASGDPDEGSTYDVRDAARVGFMDEDGDGSLSREDLVIVDLVAPEANRIDAGDLVLTPSERGSGVVLKEEDPIVGSSLRDLGLFRDLVVFLSGGSSGPVTVHDVPYLSTQATVGGGLRPGDVRLVPVKGHPFGGPVGLETGEVVPSLTRGAASVCSTRSIPGEYVPGDPIYLRLDGTCPAEVLAGMVRLVAVDDHDPMTTVHTTDPDVGVNLLSVAGAPQVKFVNVFTTAGWNDREALYLDLIATSTNRVDVGDIRLNHLDGLGAGRAVVGSDWDHGETLTTMGAVDGRALYVDVDKDGMFGSGDHAYIAPLVAQAYVGTLSVRLTPLDGSFVAPEVTDPPTSPSPTITTERSPGPDRTPEQTLDAGTTDSPTGQPGPTGAPTPGIGTVVSLLALLGIVFLARRKDKE